MPINEHKVPATLQSAVDLIIEGLDPEEITYIKTEDSATSQHFGVGRWLRNNWDLWDEEMPLQVWFRTNLGLGHADDISSIILDAVWCRIRGETYDLDSQVMQYKIHWLNEGIDPKTQERIN